MDNATIERMILETFPEMDRSAFEKTVRVMLDVLANIPEGRVTSGLAFGETNQRALDAWIKAGAVDGDEHLYGLTTDDGNDALKGDIIREVQF